MPGKPSGGFLGVVGIRLLLFVEVLGLLDLVGDLLLLDLRGHRLVGSGQRVVVRVALDPVRGAAGRLVGRGVELRVGLVAGVGSVHRAALIGPVGAFGSSGSVGSSGSDGPVGPGGGVGSAGSGAGWSGFEEAGATSASTIVTVMASSVVATCICGSAYPPCAVKLAAVSPRAERQRVVAVVGATASGKSALALELAERLGGEVVNTDSMQLYRGMDIGTAKLPPAERRGIPHHLLDVLEVEQTATVAEFQGWARDVVADCCARGVVPVLVGGSPLYTRAVLDEFDFPGTDPEVRARLEAELDRAGAAVLHERLAEIDPVAASKVLPGNGRRIVRALEVVEITGRPFSAVLPEQRYHYTDAVQVGVRIDRPTLDERIRRRVRLMWELGLVDEVRRLLPRGLRDGRTASRALGYQQVLAFLDGETTEAEAQERTFVGTRRFSRRQESWNRADDRIHWVDHDDPERLEQTLRIVQG